MAADQHPDQQELPFDPEATLADAPLPVTLAARPLGGRSPTPAALHAVDVAGAPTIAATPVAPNAAARILEMAATTLPATVPDGSFTSANVIAGGPLALRVWLDDHPELDDDFDPLAEHPLWSLRAALEGRAAASPEEAGAGVVEVLRFRGERVERHDVVRIGQRFGKVELRRRGQAFVDGAPLAADGAAFEDAEGTRVVVRYADEPHALWSAQALAERKLDRVVHGISSAAGAGALAFCGVLVWLAQYREGDVIVSDLDDGFVDVVLPPLDMTPPPPPLPPPVEPTPVKDAPPPKDPVRERPARPAPPSKAPPAAPAKSDMGKMMDALKDVSSRQSASSSIDKAIDHIRDPVIARGGLRLGQMIGHGPQLSAIGGSGGGLAGGVGARPAKDAGALAHGDVGNHGVKGKVVAQAHSLRQQGGALPAEAIRKVVESHVGEIQFCYEQQLNRNGKLGGRVVVEWVVKPDGGVGVVKAADGTNLASTAAIDCMMSKVKRWRFPRPQGGAVTVKYPFVFSAVAGG